MSLETLTIALKISKIWKRTQNVPTTSQRIQNCGKNNYNYKKTLKNSKTHKKSPVWRNTEKQSFKHLIFAEKNY